MQGSGYPMAFWYILCMIPFQAMRWRFFMLITDGFWHFDIHRRPTNYDELQVISLLFLSLCVTLGNIYISLSLVSSSWNNSLEWYWSKSCDVGREARTSFKSTVVERDTVHQFNNRSSRLNSGAIYHTNHLRHLLLPILFLRRGEVW